MAGAGAVVLRYDGQRFERLPTPGLGKQTVYGVWGKSGDDFYAVGSAAGRDGFIWHHHGGTFESEAVPVDMPDGERRGARVLQSLRSGGRRLGRRVAVPSCKFGHAALRGRSHRREEHALYGQRRRTSPIAVGGAEQRRAARGRRQARCSTTFATRTGLLQGVYVSDRGGDWASGERGPV